MKHPRDMLGYLLCCNTTCVAYDNRYYCNKVYEEKKNFDTNAHASTDSLITAHYAVVIEVNALKHIHRTSITPLCVRPEFSSSSSKYTQPQITKSFYLHNYHLLYVVHYKLVLYSYRIKSSSLSMNRVWWYI